MNRVPSRKRAIYWLEAVLIALYLIFSGFLLFGWFVGISTLALAPWWDTCCPAGMPPDGSWVRILTDPFYDAPNSYVVPGLVIGYCLVAMVWRLSRTNAKIRLAGYLSGANLALFALSLLFSYLTRTFEKPLQDAFPALQPEYSNISYAGVITNWGALALSVALIIAVYSGWSPLLDKFSPLDAVKPVQGVTV